MNLFHKLIFKTIIYSMQEKSYLPFNTPEAIAPVERNSSCPTIV